MASYNIWCVGLPCYGTYIVCGLFLAVASFFPVVSAGCFSKKSVIELTRIMKTNVEME